MTDSGIFLTGATGFLGMELLARYLERSDATVYALVRADSDAQAQERIDQAVGRMLPDPEPYLGRAVAVRGDILKPGLGLPPRMRAQLAEAADTVVHGAASVSFSLPLAESRAINVHGTSHILNFAHLASRRGDGLRRFAYISTAYVAGDHRGVFGERDLQMDQTFRNPYEQTKYEAEQLVRGHADDLPTQIFRPSIVVGEEDTGWTPAFNVIYWPLKAFARGAYKAVPARRKAPVDVVPVSYVADSIFELTHRDAASGTTYNLAAGDQASTVGELLEMSSDYFGRRRPFVIPPKPYRSLVHPLLVKRADERRRRALENSEVFFPYFGMRVRYDTVNAAAGLAGTSIRVPPLPAYFDRLMDFAVAADWGRSAPDRHDARDAALHDDGLARTARLRGLAGAAR